MALRYVIFVLWALLLTPAFAQELGILARVDPRHSVAEIADDAGHFDFALSRAVPWRARVVDAPLRLVIDSQEIDWRAMTLPEGSQIYTPRYGWSRLELPLPVPMRIKAAHMQPQNSGARLILDLEAVSLEDFTARLAHPQSPIWGPQERIDAPPAPDVSRWVVALDPGHGGVDQGAEVKTQGEVLREAPLVLSFARELKELMLREGIFTPILTREEDVFVPLTERITFAIRHQADVFISLHADSLAEGHAEGVTLYTLGADPDTALARDLAARHDRDSLLSSGPLPEEGDLLAEVLLDMARVETGPKTARLAQFLERKIKDSGLKMHVKSHQKGNFSVLKAPEVPSVLIELGFLSSAEDQGKLTDPLWRRTMARALHDALRAWFEAEIVLEHGAP